ncbi:hypothetical protein BDF22DRAFT_740088 [Syncephalis plumigaleata]|nr:hypothetical protein BDF22DRAFT_740088 [Syncephalis plumigaleata]
MKEPTCRGFNKLATQKSTLASPNTLGQLCRGESQGQISIVTGNTVNVTLEVTSHLPASPIVLARRDPCVTKDGETTWAVPMPSGISGHKVLRWAWNATNQGSVQSYEQCADISVGNVDGNKVAAESKGYATALLPITLPGSIPSSTNVNAGVDAANAAIQPSNSATMPKKRCRKARTKPSSSVPPAKLGY